MNKEQRMRRLKAIVKTNKIIAQAESKRYIVEIPGYGLRGSTRSGSSHEAINQLVQRWVGSGELNSAAVEGPLRIKLTDFKTKDTVELSVPIDLAISGSTSYPLPDFGGYSEGESDLGLNVEEYESEEGSLELEEQSERDSITSKFEDLSLVEPEFNKPRVLVTDPTMQFDPADINSLLYRSKNKAWITIPEYSRKKRIPSLYELTNNPTDHEKYFGVKTEYGYIPTIASSILLHLATKGGAQRGDLSDLVKLKIPEDYPLSGQGMDYLLTLPASIEESAIRESFKILQDAHQKPSLLRRLKYKPETDNFEYTTSHSRGVRETDPQSPLSPEMQDRMTVLNRGLSKPISKYRMLNTLTENFISKLDAKMLLLLKEQHVVNGSSKKLKPSGKRADVDDILRNIILRKIVGALQGAETFGEEGEELVSPLESAEFEEKSYNSPA